MVNSNYLIQAISDCEQALNNQDKELVKWRQACQDLGNILQGLGRFDEAIQWHSLASDSQPNLGTIYTYLGQLHLREQNWQRAIKSLKNVLQHQPNSVQAYSFLAQIYGHLGQKEAEVNHWLEAINLNPNLINAQAYHKLGRVLQSKGKLQEAIMCYVRAQERGDDNFWAPKYHLAEIWLQQGKLAKSLASYQRIIQQDSTHAKAHHKIGIIYLHQNRCEEAIIAFRQAIKLEPEFPWAYRDLVKTLIKLEKWDEAIATCHAIINLVQEYPWVYVQLGNALQKKGESDKAAASFQKACVLRGWQECKTNSYYFSRDYFSYRIPIWQSCLQPLANQPEIQILLLGNEQGMSVCWLLDKILTHPSAKLTCIQESASQQLTANLAKTKAAEKVTQLVGDIHQLANSLSAETYDLVVLQDKCKLATCAYENTSLAWNLSKTGGVLIFNDYGGCQQLNSAQNPQQGIEQFLASVQGQWCVLRQVPHAYQFIIQKKSKS